MIARVVLALCLAAAVAHADDNTTEVGGDLAPTLVMGKGAAKAELFTALSPAVDVGYRPEAEPRDEWAYGAAGSHAALGLYASSGDVTGLVFVLLGAPTDTQSAVGVDLALVRYKPRPYFWVEAGLEHIPLGIQGATATPALVFPSRVPLDSTFDIGAQAGAQIVASHDLGTVQVGVWNGTSGDISGTMPVDNRGPLLSARVEATPLGKLPFDENHVTDDLRVAVGIGATYRAATSYLADGMEGTHSRDLRATLGVRVAWYGGLVEAEVLRRQITDDLSLRPDVATGAYLQAAWRVYAGKTLIVPLARVGVLGIRELAAPATGRSIELGAAIQPGASDKLRITALGQQIIDPDLGESDRLVASVRFAF